SDLRVNQIINGIVGSHSEIHSIFLFPIGIIKIPTKRTLPSLKVIAVPWVRDYILGNESKTVSSDLCNLLIDIGILPGIAQSNQHPQFNGVGKLAPLFHVTIKYNITVRWIFCAVRYRTGQNRSIGQFGNDILIDGFSIVVYRGWKLIS